MNGGAFGENFPYTNFHDLNLDWIIRIIKELNEKVDKVLSAHITIADPIEWDISKQYEQYVIVMNNDKAYLSIAPVPLGIDINNEDYWQKIFDLSVVFESLKGAISDHDDGVSTTTSIARTAGELVWLNDTLYEITSNMTQGEEYTEANHTEVSIEDLVNELKSSISDNADAIEAIQDVLDDLQGNYIENRLVGKQIAIYGDSYSVAPLGTLWQTVLNQMTGGTCHVQAQGSLPLPDIYSTLWDNYNADIYIIEGGLNDVGHNTTGNNFMLAISNFVTAIRNVNSNAEIYFISPNDIPFSGAHDYLYPQEFYRQCYWHTMTRFGFHVIDGLKWAELKYSDGTHPTTATAPLIGKYIFESLLKYGDSVNFRDDYSKAGRNNTQILFMMQNGEPYLYTQNLQYPVTGAVDGTGSIDLSDLGCDFQVVRQAFINKSSGTYTQGFMMFTGTGTPADPNTLIIGIAGATQGTTQTVNNGYSIRLHPNKWVKDLGI